MFQKKTFFSIQEMKVKLIAQLNEEFGNEFYSIHITDKYLYLRCKVDGCKFCHGYTYCGDHKDESTLTSITSTVKVGIVHKHNIEPHFDFNADRDANCKKSFTFKDAITLS